MSGLADSFKTSCDVHGRLGFDEIEATACLNASARQSLCILAQRKARPQPAGVKELMAAYGWTAMRAWRHWLGYSKTEMARRAGIHVSTYELIEDGTVELGPFLQPAVEEVLLA